MCYIALVRCVLVLRCGSARWCGILMQAEALVLQLSNVSTSIFMSLRLIVDLFHVLYCSGSMCVGDTVWFGWVVWYPYAGFSLHKDRIIIHALLYFKFLFR